MEREYQVEYQVNGVPILFEFYLFVNPLGRQCLYSELATIASKERSAVNIDLHVVPFHNHQVIKRFAERLTKEPLTLSQRNDIYRRIYQACLAFKAACLQGKANGRNYLIALQSYVHGHIDRFNQDLLFEKAEEVDLDMTMFKEDYQSDFVRQLYLRDQNIASEMNIQDTPSLVIYEHQSGTARLLSREELTAECINAELDAILEDFYLESSHTHPACPTRPTLRLISKH